jgi:hypothetical protein
MVGAMEEDPAVSHEGLAGRLTALRRNVAPLALAAVCLAFLIPAQHRPLVARFFREHPPWSWPQPGWGALTLLTAGTAFFLLLWSRTERAGRVLLLLGLVVFLFKAVLIAPIEYVGHADPASYAEMARSLCERRGLEVDYISFYYHPLDPGIARPEDHWPPFYSFVTVPFFLALGVTGFAAKLASLLISSLLLPCAGYALARRVADAPGAGFAAGLNLMLLPEHFEPSLWPNSDGAFAFLVVLTAWLFTRGIEHPRSFLWMGLAGALSNYAKGIGILLLPAFGLFGLWYAAVRRPVVPDEPAPWLSGWRRAALCLAVALVPLAFASTSAILFFLPSAGGFYLLGRWYARAGAWQLPPHRRAVWRNLIAGFVIWGLVLLPMCLRNVRYFGAPFYSTLQYAPGFQTVMKFEAGCYPLYWGRDVPSVANLFSDRSALMQTAKKNLVASARLLLEPSHSTWFRARPGTETRPSWWPLRPYNEAIRACSDPRGCGLGVWLPGLAAWTALLLAAVAATYRLLAGTVSTVARWSRRHARPPDRLRLVAGHIAKFIRALLAPWLDARILAVAAPGAIVVLFVSVLWLPTPRYLLPARALVMVLGSVALFHILRLPSAALTAIVGRLARGRSVNASRIASAALAMFTLLLAAGPTRQVWDLRAANLERDRREGAGVVALGRWIHDHLPDAVIMTRNPWEWHFHSNRSTVQIPLAPLEETLGVAKYFGVTHIIPDRLLRPALRPLVNGSLPGLTPVQDAPGGRLYRLDFDALPPAMRNPPAPGTGRPPMNIGARSAVGRNATPADDAPKPNGHRRGLSESRIDADEP